jgi:oligopeptidase B
VNVLEPGTAPETGDPLADGLAPAEAEAEAESESDGDGDVAPAGLDTIAIAASTAKLAVTTARFLPELVIGPPLDGRSRRATVPDMHGFHHGPPAAATESSTRHLHGLTVADEYAWMRDADDPRLLDYLRASREHYDRATEHLSDLRAELFSEVERRMIPTDDSVSWKRGDLFYYMRSVTGSEYGQFVSTRDRTMPGQVVLDEATLASEPGGHVDVGVREVSPDGTLLAYAVDTDGDEVYTLRYRDMATCADLPDTAPRCYYGGAWSRDSTVFFYTVHDDLYRPHQVWRHRIGTGVDDDILVYAEDDARYDVNVRASTSGDHVFIISESRDTTEVWSVPADKPDTAPAIVRARRTGIEYSLDDAGDDFIIVTNEGADEFRLMTAPIAVPEQWVQSAPARAGERLIACHVLATHLVMEIRRDGFPLIRTVDRSSGAEREISSGTPAGRVALDEHLDYQGSAITIEVESLTSPNAWSEVDLASGGRTLRKQVTVPGYDPAAYRTERRHAPAPDGTLVPVTLAYRADTPLDGSAPCLMWGYGAYESCDDPEFDPMLASLLDRGFVYALTHPRGGGENGRQWWLGGRLATKHHTFSDHLAVANWLAGVAPDATGGTGENALVDGARIVTRGLSAGGLLQARCLALAPARWAAVVAEVPFVDVIGSMLDPSIPLTVNEWDEWGDPRKADEFGWMDAYSPYERMPSSPRPPVLVTAALHDPRVMVHEPAKYVARMRATAADDDELVFRVEMGAGAHTGPAGRYAHFRYEAEVYAFILDRLGITE